MKKGDKRVHVDVIENRMVDGKEVKVKIGEKDIYEIRNSGGGFFDSWHARNSYPRPNSKRQQRLREDAENKKRPQY